MEDAPDSLSGRVLRYVCAECGDTLSPRMSLEAFENGYWYQTELVAFAKKLGLPAAHRMRKTTPAFHSA